MDKRMAEDKVEAEILKDQLVALKDNQAFRLFREALGGRLSLAQRSLAAEQDPVRLYRLQGRITGLQAGLGLLDELVKKVSNELRQYELQDQGDLSNGDRPGSAKLLG